jgi:hypothetical protein
MQYQQARRLLAVPYATFLQLAHTLPGINRLIVVYMLPRSGSTLVSHLLNAVDGVVSFAEPDAPMDLVVRRPTPSGGEDSRRALLDAALRFLFKPGTWGTPVTCALKPRPSALQIMDLFQATFPRARSLYLYRDALGFVASYYRILQRRQPADSMPIEEYLDEVRS